MKRVLIIRSGAVGDLVLTLPVLAALKERYDGISIDMMGDPVRLALLKQCGYVDKVLSIDDRDFTIATIAAPTVQTDLVDEEEEEEDEEEVEEGVDAGEVETEE